MVQQIMISHYATGGPGQHLLPGLEEATSDDKSPVLVFILTVNNDWSKDTALSYKQPCRDLRAHTT